MSYRWITPVINNLVFECCYDVACDGWQWSFTDVYDVGSTWRLYSFAVHQAAIGVVEALGCKGPNYFTLDQGSPPSTTGIVLTSWLLGELGFSLRLEHDHVPCLGTDFVKVPKSCSTIDRTSAVGHYCCGIFGVSVRVAQFHSGLGQFGVSLLLSMYLSLRHVASSY